MNEYVITLEEAAKEKDKKKIKKRYILHIYIYYYLIFLDITHLYYTKYMTSNL